MNDLEIKAAGSSFVRPGGREGWRLDDRTGGGPDDRVVSPFDFVSVAGGEAADALDELARKRPGMTPMMLGSPHEAGLLFEKMRPDRTEAWLAQARTLDIDGWVAARAFDVEARCVRDGTVWPKRGDWPDFVMPLGVLATPRDSVTGTYKPVVIIALLPGVATEAAAHLRFGGWNDCPPPSVHVAFARRWFDRYGAVQVANTHGVAEFRVARPVTTQVEAIELARVHYYYCSNSVPDTLEAAAAGLIGSTVWYFRWD